jgi:hypothetical protein
MKIDKGTKEDEVMGAQGGNELMSLTRDLT